jgi:hypothetical protein
MVNNHLKLICYDWKNQLIIHEKLSIDDVTKSGTHKRCGKKVAIPKTAWNPDDLDLRRVLKRHNIQRWYTHHDTPNGLLLEIGVLPNLPDPLDYIKELRKKLKK